MIWIFFILASPVSLRHHRFGQEERVHQIEYRRRFLRVVDRRAELRTVPHSVGEVSGELFHLAGTVFVAVFHQHPIVTPHHLVAILLSRLPVSARGDILFDLPEDPGIGAGGAADHYRIAARLPHHADSVLGRRDVAIADHWNLHRGFHFGDARPIGLAAVALLAGARVERNGLQSTVLREARHLDGHQFTIVPPRTELHGEWDGQNFAYFAQQSLDQWEVAEQAGP